MPASATKAPKSLVEVKTVFLKIRKKNSLSFSQGNKKSLIPLEPPGSHCLCLLWADLVCSPCHEVGRLQVEDSILANTQTAVSVLDSRNSV